MLAACDQAFGHRLMMDGIVPGGVAQDITADGGAAIAALLDDVAPRFAEIVALYDDTPSLQDRTCTTGIVSRGPGQRSGRRAAMSAAPPAAISMPAAISPIRRIDGLAFEVPLLTRATSMPACWVRIDEVGASIGDVRGWLAGLPEGPVRAGAASRA